MSSEANKAQNPSQQADQASGPSESPGAAGADAKATSPTVEQLTAEKQELNDRLLRLAAEFENYKRRVRKEAEDASQRGLEGLAKELLPALDNFDRALTAARGNQAPGVAVIIEGVQMVQKQLFAALEKNQIKTFESEGKPFDPNVHEAIQQVETDAVPPGAVALVFQRGYTIGSRLLRPAMVAVARARTGGDSSAN
ncbi:MAG: nucleotide exchange factor GrpE [Polyangia bacterium]